MATNTVHFKLEGAEEIIAKLKSLEISRDEEVKILKHGAEVVRDAARSIAPVYSGPSGVSYYRKNKKYKQRRRGQLRRSIKVDASARRGVYVRVYDPLGHLLEYGHKTRLGQKQTRNYFSKFRKQRTKKGGKAFVSPQPYLRPGIDSSRQQALDAIAREVEQLIMRGAT